MLAAAVLQSKAEMAERRSKLAVHDNESLRRSLNAFRAGVEDGNLLAADTIWKEIKSSVFITTTMAVSKGGRDFDDEALEAVSLLREVLEYACILHLEHEDVAGFNKCFTVLQPVYTDFSQPILQQSSNEAPLTAIHLLYLVALGRLGELQVFLQRLPEHVLTHNDIVYVVQVEKYFTVGNYEKCITAVLNPPNKFLKLICKSLMDSIRIQVADILRKSHQRIPIERATKLLMIDSRKELEAFVAKMNVRGAAVKQSLQEDVPDETEIRNEESSQRPDVYSWEFSNDHIVFTTVLDNRRQIPVQELTNYVLNYAAELERIV